MTREHIEKVIRMRPSKIAARELWMEFRGELESLLHAFEPFLDAKTVAQVRQRIRGQEAVNSED